MESHHVWLMAMYEQFQMWFPEETRLKNYFLWIWSPVLNLYNCKAISTYLRTSLQTC